MIVTVFLESLHLAIVKKMSDKKNTETDKNQNKAEEPATAYKTIRVFNSFEEAEEFEAKQRAALSYDKRMKHIEELRKRVFNRYLLPNGTWPPISKKFKIMKPYTNDPGKQL